MEIVNIEASAFMEMNDILFKIEKQLKGLNSSKSELNEWLDNQMNGWIIRMYVFL